MSSDVKHDFWVDGDPPVLMMANDDDSYYIQTFVGWSEVDAFIERMRAEAEKAFGPNAELRGRPLADGPA